MATTVFFIMRSYPGRAAGSRAELGRAERTCETGSLPAPPQGSCSVEDTFTIRNATPIEKRRHHFPTGARYGGPEGAWNLRRPAQGVAQHGGAARLQRAPARGHDAADHEHRGPAHDQPGRA